MNNTRNLTIVAILIAATLVVGVTFAATTQSAFAARKGDKKIVEMVIQLPNRNANNTA